MRSLFLAVILVSLCAPHARAVRPGSEAHYYLASSAESQSPPIHRVRVAAGPVERRSGRSYQWWEMTLEKPEGSVIGVKVLSQRVPLTSREPVGDVARYIYSPGPEECLEYVDDLTGAALLPELRTFAEDYFPQAAREARYSDGFATTGRLMGHVLVRSNVRPDFPTLDFGKPTVLRLRSDLRIGSQTDGRDDRDETVPIDKRNHTPYTREEYMEMIAAGANYFHPAPEAIDWIKNLPVFWAGRGTHPDDFYRSNYVPGSMFTDEPATRFGWSKGVPGDIVGPEVIAEAIKMRLEEAERPKNREFQCENWFNTGAMEALYDKHPSWDTQQYTAWYQLAGGAPGLVFEGRYVKRGYGWVPEALLGHGLEGLDDKQQYDYFHASMRGAARRWNGYWGTSVYPEGDKSMMIPALVRAYDQGARRLWFWCDRNLPYRWRLQVLRGLSEHIKQNPRRPGGVASAAIVLPPGYMLAEDTIWGMNREQINGFGVSYADIASAALFEGIMLSREGVEYDYVNDHDGLRRAGYKQLIYIREDGRVERSPKLPNVSAPKGLTLELRQSGAQAPQSKEADHVIPRASGMKIDGDLRDWSGADWIEMQGQPYHFGDNYDTQIKLIVPADVSDTSDQKCMGFWWEQISEEYRRKYLLEGYHDDQVVVSMVTPGGAAERAGLREGDVILQFAEKRIRWGFEVWGLVERYKRQPNAEVDIMIQRNGVDRLGGPKDLSARFAITSDDRDLYFAADVTDDVHRQTMRGPDFWMNDCVQLGIDPTLARSVGYGEDGHEIGLALADGKAVVWRWAGRRGQPVNVVKSARAAIVPKAFGTVYEAAIPIAELAPLAPDMWPRVGMCVVVNDSDDGVSRKARLELVPGAMTRGKKLNEFPVFEFAPSADRKKLSAAIFWRKRCVKTGGAAELAVAVSSPETREAKLRCRLMSLDDPDTKPVTAEIGIAVTDRPTEHVLSARTLSPPGRYRLEVEVVSPDGRVAARDALPVYVYE